MYIIYIVILLGLSKELEKLIVHLTDDKTRKEFYEKKRLQVFGKYHNY